MSTHFSISLGLLIACGVHAFAFLKLEINQNVTILKKEQVLHVILNKAPEKKTIFETPAIQPSVQEKIETPTKKIVELPKQTKNKKTHKKQKVIDKTPKKNEIKQIEQQKNEPVQQNNNIEQFETPQETTSMVSEQQIQETTGEIQKIEKKTKTANYKKNFFCPKPLYPFVAKQRGIEGKVKLALNIDENGAVVDAKILASDPEDMFEEAALEAVMQCRNFPEQLFNSTVEQTIKFELKTED